MCETVNYSLEIAAIQPTAETCFRYLRCAREAEHEGGFCSSREMRMSVVALRFPLAQGSKETSPGAVEMQCHKAEFFCMKHVLKSYNDAVASSSSSDSEAGSALVPECMYLLLCFQPDVFSCAPSG